MTPFRLRTTLTIIVLVGCAQAPKAQTPYSRDDLITTCRVLSNLAREAEDTKPRRNPRVGLLYSAYQEVKEKIGGDVDKLNCDKTFDWLRSRYADIDWNGLPQRSVGGGAWQFQTLPPDAHIVLGVEVALDAYESGMDLSDLGAAIEYDLSGIDLNALQEQIRRGPSEQEIEAVREALSEFEQRPLTLPSGN